ncbi:inosine-5-monophosphate dehydrogenase [Stenotrophomonas panacihumi]|uniref:Inosine-5-monophosphate dehydrogenase n=1 Tax=Stenotrophomonas panacihumi TaxID=676599 RepID=A0A0R0AHV8_9GAMM|nr:CBS domain-containing protein [Stenotrophomonas panacihumi]KRG44621.1 inosine-5-monophosphate dehydrogenase [Stenotrophomonas panacihumi]PTN55023.1 CBS domain-containing protein [Stenotrophomonas panacihumi]
MIIENIMSRDVQTVRPDQSLREAAQTMRTLNIGSLPVRDHDRLVGMLTDRDIVVRGVAEGGVEGRTVSEVMSPAVKYCYASDDVQDIARNMASLEVRRLPVVDADKRLVGIVSLANMVHSEPAAAAVMSQGVATPH